jgi:tetratricopeptide (TPR) repeat protein
MEFFDKIRLDEWFYEADQNIKDQRFADAMQTLESIIAESPDYGKAYNHLGWLYETKYYDYKRAEECYQKCLDLEPEYTPVYLNLAVVLSGMRKWKELEDLLNKAIETPGVDQAAAFNEFGIMYEMKGEYTLAIKNYKTAIRMSLKNAKIDAYRDAIDRCKVKMDILKN